MKYSRKVAILFSMLYLLVFCLGTKHQTAAQTQLDYKLILRKSDGIVAVDLSNQRQELTYAFSGEGLMTYHSVTLDADNNIAYVITRSDEKRGPRHQRQQMSLPSEIKRVDLISQQETIIFNGQNLIEMLLSPNEDKAVITYFSSQDATIATFCVLNLADGLCQDSNIMIDRVYTLSWLDNTNILVLYDFQLIIYDTLAFTYEPLDQYAGWFSLMGVPFPLSKDNLLIYGVLETPNGYIGKFTRYDMRNQIVEELSIQANTLVDGIMLSPDERYLLYGVDKHYTLVTLNSAETVTEFDNLREMMWLPDSSGLVGVSLVDSANPSYALFHYDIQSDSFSVLAEYSAYISIEGIVGSDS